MPDKINQRLTIQTIAVYATALLTWTLLFINNPFLSNVLVDIHLIFTSTLLAYLLLRLAFSPSIIDFIKIFIRTLFRVWLLIFISFAISKSMDRIGPLLSLTFIFGYLEGLLDINRWLESEHPFTNLFPKLLMGNKLNHAMATITLMSIIHILCAITVFIFYLFFK